MVADFESEGIYSIFRPSFAIIGGKAKRKKTFFHANFQKFSRSRKLLIVQCNIDRLIDVIRLNYVFYRCVNGMSLLIPALLVYGPIEMSSVF